MPKQAKLIRINPTKDISSVFSKNKINFIDANNFYDRIDFQSKDIEIMHIQQTAVSAISDIYD